MKFTFEDIFMDIRSWNRESIESIKTKILTQVAEQLSQIHGYDIDLDDNKLNSCIFQNIQQRVAELLPYNRDNGFMWDIEIHDEIINNAVFPYNDFEIRNILQSNQLSIAETDGFFIKEIKSLIKNLSTTNEELVTIGIQASFCSYLIAKINYNDIPFSYCRTQTDARNLMIITNRIKVMFDYLKSYVLIDSCEPSSLQFIIPADEQKQEILSKLLLAMKELVECANTFFADKQKKSFYRFANKMHFIGRFIDENSIIFRDMILKGSALNAMKEWQAIPSEEQLQIIDLSKFEQVAQDGSNLKFLEHVFPIMLMTKNVANFASSFNNNPLVIAKNLNSFSSFSQVKLFALLVEHNVVTFEDTHRWLLSDIKANYKYFSDAISTIEESDCEKLYVALQSDEKLLRGITKDNIRQIAKDISKQQTDAHRESMLVENTPIIRSEEEYDEEYDEEYSEEIVINTSPKNS